MDGTDVHLAAAGLSGFEFEPDGERAHALDIAMASSLRRSLGTIRVEAAGVVHCRVADSLARAVDDVRLDRRERPVVWALYADLCDAIASDDIAAANSAAAALDDALGAPSAPYVSNLHDRHLGVGYAALYAKALDDDRANPRDLVAVDEDEVARARGLIGEARDLIGSTCPDLLSEMDALVREIVLVSGRPGGNEFAGAATLFLWGAIFINPTTIPDRLAMAEALTHEAAHAVLTGLTGGLDVTANDRHERYPSPLRADPRPVEGVAHAAFVLARMTLMLDRLADARCLDDLERTRLDAMRAANAGLYDTAMLTLREHAHFTLDGAAIFDACDSFMQQRRS